MNAEPDLSTTYLGLELKNPIIVGAGPLGDCRETVIALEQAGAAALVMHSLFEEQLHLEMSGREAHLEAHGESFGEATSYFPAAYEYTFKPERYLEHLRWLKKSVGIPIIASLNGTTPGGWTLYAEMLQDAGADALELNFYYPAIRVDESAAEVEKVLLDTITDVRSVISLPLAVKLSPFYTSLGHVARRAVSAGADGLVLFNRFYQPDIDPEKMETVSTLRLSSSNDLLLRLRWLAALRDKVDASLACTGGIHQPIDVIKSVLAGADAVQVVSSLLKHGPEHIEILLKKIRSWFQEHYYDSVHQLKGAMSMRHCPEPAAYERGNYLKIVQGWKI
ncbi:MAG: dihydroorotate dehydrogenase-like protein [Blastochloris sp.]|nr:dihydroorotate dehydrogenase-like protein [Blastochloris sp.]